ncbi:MAG TPA: DNA polymerase/3'-5' exonuclease PolX [Deltaproteobacteria bacterium]|nr:DNA polymerase/3'-5' exonuclease PolX [Deltaproteobacteria bacterium]
MENAEIAAVLADIADLLEIKGENAFRVRSYRNAALAIDSLPVKVSTIVAAGARRLEEIPGVGRGIAEKIVELVTTGGLAYLDALEREIPRGLIEVLRVQGMGPKKTALVFRELGVRGLDDLEAAARAGKLRALAGMGEKTEQKVLRSIAQLRRMSGRHRLAVVMAVASELVAYLRGCEGVGRVEAAGSLRRLRDTVGDLDVLVSARHGEPLMERFVAWEAVREVLAKGATRTSVILRNGLQVDVRVVDDGSFGAALQYFTGSKAHNVALRERAVRMGLKISEYGVFDAGDGRRIAGADEAGVYGAVGLPWIPPELRENLGEIEAAEKGELPAPLEVGDIAGDLHCHTTASDGSATIEEMAGAAMDLGYEYLAVTDHSQAVSIAHGLDEKRLARHMEAVDDVNAALSRRGSSFKLLKGAEVDIRADGSLDYGPAALKGLDCVVAAVHSAFNMPGREMTARIVRALSTGLVHILAHPTGRLLTMREPYDLDMEEITASCRKYDVALELNCSPERLDLSDTHLRLARSRGVPVVISTDAHAPQHLSNITLGVRYARRGWIEKKHVLNSRNLKQLMKFLRR